ncbi:50S ribosomal protein L15e, partial [Candidatus Woesearchaeota archaeon]|nr:50S ribosomal protein L15e [Candidatus Woesearchaeota archaeon]
LRGGHKRPMIKKGRRPRNYSQRMDLDKSYQRIAEERANKKYPNCEVLNSYWVAKDGRYYWYEIILIDKAHPAIKADKNLCWIAERHQKGRVFRGLTSTGKKSRGLKHKGKGFEKMRPSKKAHY